ncbi:WYL domain-containing protein [Psychroflexus sp. CAK1W]|uniref:helix-turn-helix transcriptional regulator n=1 Tax=Psychroflexus curvus TaxID=2873595 RepID=UPI001CCD4082|nr:WYL domain-containing protein [Psychroflexus curvus]MBZ9628158.1 WYL domain-containing protein [Psychroflexus curvus]
MATTKNATIRYQTLDRCFRNPGRRYDIEDLLEECNKQLIDFEPMSDGIKKRQLYQDIKFMESSQGWSILLDRKKEGRITYYKYEDVNFSINNQPINQLEAEQLKSAMIILQRFKGLPQFKWINEILPKIDQAFSLTEDTGDIISFDNNEFLKGLEFIDPLFKAILYKKVIKIVYQSFKNPKQVEIVFSPYHLKEYNNRWFLFGKDSSYDNIINIALDRIVAIEESSFQFEKCEINFEDYFFDVLGVSYNPNQPVEKIIIRVSKALWPYIETKPLHGSQKVKDRQEDYVDISLDLILNYELETLLLSFGEKIKVLEPQSLVEKLKERIYKLKDNYQCT